MTDWQLISVTPPPKTGEVLIFAGEANDLASHVMAIGYWELATGYGWVDACLATDLNFIVEDAEYWAHAPAHPNAARMAEADRCWEAREALAGQHQ